MSRNELPPTRLSSRPPHFGQPLWVLPTFCCPPTSSAIQGRGVPSTHCPSTGHSTFTRQMVATRWLVPGPRHSGCRGTLEFCRAVPGAPLLQSPDNHNCVQVASHGFAHALLIARATPGQTHKGKSLQSFLTTKCYRQCGILSRQGTRHLNNSLIFLQIFMVHRTGRGPALYPGGYTYSPGKEAQNQIV